MTTPRPDYWFAAKRYGFGWGMPTRWQGWLVLGGYLGLVGAGIGWFIASQNRGGLLLYLLALTALFVIVLAWKGEKPLRWRWGGR